MLYVWVMTRTYMGSADAATIHEGDRCPQFTQTEAGDRMQDRGLKQLSRIISTRATELKAMQFPALWRDRCTSLLGTG